MDVNDPSQRLLYGLSYERRLFDRYGWFREDLRAGEDTEFNARLGREANVVAATDVRTAHRYPTTISAMLRDTYRRGRLQAAMVGQIERGPQGRPSSIRVATRGPRNILRSLWCIWRTSPPARARLLRAWPLVAVGGVVYAVGALSASWRPYDGYDAVAPSPRTSQKADG